MKTLTTLFFTITFFYSYSQIWNLGTQSCIGGTDVDNIYGSLLLSNGNTLLYGTSTSGISGDKTEAHIGGDDIWLIALDNNQQIVWQKTIGGLLDDRPAKIIETIDHKLMLASYSNSLIGGLKTAPNFGSTDVWLIKMDLTGTIIWDKTYGGTLADGVNDIIELPSKNIIITSSSNSDISGNKLSGNIGLEDTWLLKIDQNGLVLLDKTIGGSNYESGGNLCVTNNSFFYLAVTSFSDISGDKTENSYGYEDIWVCKIDTNLTILQDKTFGGDNIDSNPLMQLLPNGELFIIGISSSNISGNKTENSFGNGYEDCWLLKLDASLTILNQKTIGSNKDDFPKTINQLANNKILIGLSSDSDANVYKSEPKIGNADVWFITIDENFNFLEDKTIGSTSRELLGGVIETSPYNFTVFTSSTGINTGNKTCSGSNVAPITWASPTDFWVFNLNTTLGLSEISSKESFTLFPNPVINTFTINSKNTISSLEISTLDGKMVQQKNVNEMSSTMDVELMPSGIYLCKLFLENGETNIVRFVKE